MDLYERDYKIMVNNTVALIIGVIVITIILITLFILLKKLCPTLKKNKDLFENWIIGSIGFFLVVAVLYIVHCLFNYYPKDPWFVAVWEPGELITFIGTISLGCVTYIQTKNHMICQKIRIKLIQN